MKLILQIAFITCVALFVFCLAPAQAETITLHDGTTIEGKIVEQTNEHIRVLDAAGFIHKYSLTDIEKIGSAEAVDEAGAEFVPLKKQPEQGSFNKAQGEVASVRAQLEENLKKTEAMIKNTLRQLYSFDAGQNTFEDYKDDEAFHKNSASPLQEERDRKYRKYKKYY